jgi:hypothetical protein
MGLEELKTIVIQERAVLARIVAQKDAAVAALDATPEKAAVTLASEALRQQSLKVDQVENDLRTLALVKYKDTGNKNPVPGISIKIYKTYVFDAQKARDWAALAAPAMLVLDTKLFEKLAPDMPGAPIAVLDNPKAMLAKDLEA